MLKNIIFTLAIGGLLTSFSMTAKAEGSFFSPIKAPFSIFGDKKEPQKEDEFNLKTEQNTEIQKPNKVLDPKNDLGVIYAENTLNKAEFYFEEKDLESTTQAINSIKNWLYDATEYHTDLFKTLENLENSEAQANIERNLAINFAVLRDKMLFLEAKLLLKKGEKQQAVENLVEVVRSQPTTDIGFSAYEMLKDVGFTYGVNYGSIE